MKNCVGRLKPLILALLVMCSMLLSGCSGNSEPSEVSETTVQVSEDGTVTYWLVGDFDKSYYSLSELSSMVNTEIELYNEEQEENGYTAEVESVTMTEDNTKAVVKLLFSEGEAYRRYAGKKLFYGTVAEAQQAGYDLNVEVASVKDDSVIDKNGIFELASSHILIVQGAVTVYCPYSVQYITESAVLNDDGSVTATEEDGYTYIILKK